MESIPKGSIRGDLHLGWLGACPPRPPAERCVVAALANPDPVEREKASRLYKARTHANAEELIAAGGLDALVIQTPTPFHATQVLAGWRAGLPIFCEKPFCRNADEVVLLRNTLKAGAPRTQVNFEFRVSGVPRRFHQLAATHIGHPVHFFWRVLDEGWSTPRHPLKPWKMDVAETGGFINEKLCHYLDLAQWMMGEPIARVSACAAPILTRGSRGIWDNVSIHGWCSSGATVHVAWCTTAPTRKFYAGGVVGARGAVFWDWWLDDCLVNRLTVTRHDLDAEGRMRETRPVEIESYAEGDQKALTHNNHASLQDLINRLLGIEPVGETVCAQEALDLVDLCLASERSAREGGCAQEVGAPSQKSAAAS
ncbi:MAG: Gfo/Idh/MocA family oxidoreductase [Verrucomicrobiae bacterium]|nr:Gfo/Idh/MocA family oxidoreductase [Verrucomicrobiae bacterium]